MLHNIISPNAAEKKKFLKGVKDRWRGRGRDKRLVNAFAARVRDKSSSLRVSQKRGENISRPQMLKNIKVSLKIWRKRKVGKGDRSEPLGRNYQNLFHTAQKSSFYSRKVVINQSDKSRPGGGEPTPRF